MDNNSQHSLTSQPRGAVAKCRQLSFGLTEKDLTKDLKAPFQLKKGLFRISLGLK